MGWSRIIPQSNLPKSVICVAPHSSNLDFLLGKLYYWSIGRKAGFLMKKSWFFFPVGYIFKAMGGVPIDRSKKGSTVDQMARAFAENREFHIAITPEGTRSRSEKWKTGFYRIAMAAGVPIQLALIDYKKKEIGIFAEFTPTGNEEEDIRWIRSQFRADQARHPEKFAELEAPTK